MSHFFGAPRIIKTVKYAPTSLAKNTTVTLMSAAELADAIPASTPLSLVMHLSGGGMGIGVNSVLNVVTSPAIVYVKSASLGNWINMFPMPGGMITGGGADGPTTLAHCGLAYAQYQTPIPAVDDWVVEIRNDGGNSQSACAIATGNPVFVNLSLVAGYLPDSGYGHINVLTTGNYTTNTSLGLAVSWKASTPQQGTAGAGALVRLRQAMGGNATRYMISSVRSDLRGATGGSLYLSESAALATATIYTDNAEGGTGMGGVALQNSTGSSSTSTWEAHIEWRY